jgi:beta-lactamase regulating signal transducer with metallopeptidase domain
MQSFMPALLGCSVGMSVLALLYMAIAPLLAKRYSEKGLYYAWLIVVTGLLVPFRPQWGKAAIRVDLPRETVMPVIRIGNGTPGSAEGAALPSALSSVSWWQIAAAVWLAGVIAFLAYHIIRHCVFVRTANRWSESPADEQPLALLRNLQSEMGISGRISLRRCSSIGSPMLIGFINPRILLPEADFAQDELRFILKHELVHCKRRDLWYKALVLLAMAMHWFNPIVRLAAKAIDALCELSCDAEVVRNADADARRHYGETIIGVVRYRSRLKTALSTYFYGGKKGMKNRIASVMDTSKKRAGAAVVCVVLFSAVGTGFAFALSNGQAEFPPERLRSESDARADASESSRTMAYIDEAAGVTIYSRDDGATWISPADEEYAEYAAAFRAPDIEWWTYDEYKAWLENEKPRLQDMIGGKAWSPADGWYIWTQAHTDEAIAMYEKVLQDLKDGRRVSKPAVADAQDDAAAIYGTVQGMTIDIGDPESETAQGMTIDIGDPESEAAHGMTIRLGIAGGEESVSFGPYATKEALFARVKAYCEEQLRLGRMTRREVDEILSEL